MVSTNRKTTLVPITNNEPAIIDAADYGRMIPWHHKSGRVFQIRVSDFSWCNTGSKGRIVPGIHTTRDNIVLRVRLHRLIIGAKPGQIVDHINFNTLDNRKCNLRFLTAHENSIWRQPMNRTSKYHGVHWDRGCNKWRVQLTVNYKRVHIGLYANEEDAARAFDSIAASMHGHLARFNFPVV